MAKNKLKRLRRTILFSIVLVLTVITIYQDLNVTNTFYDLTFDNLPDNFSGYRIAQVSDLHNASFGAKNSQLIDSLRTNKPDIIVITGDLVDSNHTDLSVALDFVKEAGKIAPTYYVTGNHEARIGPLYDELEKGLLDLDVKVLRNQTVTLKQGQDMIKLIGLDDPSFLGQDNHISLNSVEGLLEGLLLEKDHFIILLSHRPELFDVYTNQSINLVFSGHAHGGQFRIPFLGGLVAPNQGLFPKYDSGVFNQGQTQMVVSRGIGNSIIPIRINNQPEVVYVNLLKK